MGCQSLAAPAHLTGLVLLLNLASPEMGNARTLAPWTDGNKRAGALMFGRQSPEESCVVSGPSNPDMWW